MPSRQQQNRITLSSRINRVGKMVFPCSRCAQQKVECRRILGAKKCGNCTRRGCKCDVQDVTAPQFERIDKERQRIKSEIRQSREAMEAAMARWKRFERLQESLEEREAELIRRGLDNIEELERVEAEEKAASSLASAPSPLDPITLLEDFSCEIPPSQWADFLNTTNDVSTVGEASRS